MLTRPRGSDISVRKKVTYVSSISQELIGRSYYLFACLAV